MNYDDIYDFSKPAETFDDFLLNNFALKEQLKALELAPTMETAKPTSVLVVGPDGVKNEQWNAEFYASTFLVHPPTGNGYLKYRWNLNPNLASTSALAELKAKSPALLEEIHLRADYDHCTIGALDGKLGVFVYVSEPDHDIFAEEHLAREVVTPEKSAHRHVLALQTGTLQAKYPDVKFGVLTDVSATGLDEVTLMLGFVPIEQLLRLSPVSSRTGFPSDMPTYPLHDDMHSVLHDMPETTEL